MADLTLESLLSFEAKWWINAGPKEAAIRETFGLSPVRYYQLLGLAIDTEEAMRTDPATVRRLKSIREQARAWRRAG